MPIFQAGSVNTTAIVVPDLYVQVQPPQALRLNGVPSNVVGVVGVASWGPVDLPLIIGGMADFDREFGVMRARAHDMGTVVATAVLQRAADFRCVRVTDGTDAAATLNVANAGTFTAAHTGTLGNAIRISISTGSKPGTHRAVVGFPGRVPEVFDNLTDATFWTDLASAMNMGQSLARPASQVVGFVPATVTSLAVSTTTLVLAGGTDGDAVNSAQLIGAEASIGIAGTGLFSLRGSGCALVTVADLTDPTTLTTLAYYGASEGSYVIAVGEAGQSVVDAKSAKQNAGLDSPAVMLLMGDWVFFNDPISQTTRLVSPQGFVAGLYGNLSPEQSALNKVLYGVVGSQRTGIVAAGRARRWSTAELTEMFRAGIDIVTNPAPGGHFWAVRGGFNSSTDATVKGDNYPRLTNYVASTLDAGMGLYVGRTITPDLLDSIRSTLSSFLGNMKLAGQIQGFTCKCDRFNNPSSQTELDIVQADVVVRYNGINRVFLVNLLAGQTVSITVQN